MENADYTYHRVDESRYDDLLYLYERAFGTSTTISYYRNKFDTGYLGITHLGYLAYDSKGKPAAFYGVYPYPTEYGGKLYIAAQSGDTMTHPAHGGKGLFTTLAKLTYTLAKAEGVQFIFGFPNKNSLPGFVKRLSWTQQPNIKNYLFKVKTLPLAALAKRINFLMPVYTWYVQLIARHYGDNTTIFPSSSLEQEIGSVRRSQAYYKYKMFYRNYLVNLNGTQVWIKVDGSLLVGDIDRNSSKQITETINRIKKIALLLGCTKIIFGVAEGSHWDLALEGSTRVEEGIFVGYLDLQSGLPLDRFKYMMADMDTF